MSSASQIAVAKVCSPFADPSCPPESECRVDLDAALTDNTQWRATFDAQPANSEGNVLAFVWQNLVQGRMRVGYQTTTHNSTRLIAHVDRVHDSLCPSDAGILLRVLCGDPQKALASDLGIANSTVSGRFVGALIKLGLGQRPVPLPIVLAAQTEAGLARVGNATDTRFEQDGHPCIAISVPRPRTSCLEGLTRAEQEVAQALMEGCTRSEIAIRRTTSMFTVTRQFSSIFSTLRVTGRYALIRCAAEHGCFA